MYQTYDPVFFCREKELRRGIKFSKMKKSPKKTFFLIFLCCNLQDLH